MDIYIGNLSNYTTEADLQQKFEQYGDVASVMIMIDRVSTNPLGFAFVEMPNENQAQKAVESLKRAKIKDRCVMVSLAGRRSDRRMSSVEVEETVV